MSPSPHLEKMGGSNFRDTFWEHLKGIISSIELVDVNPEKGKYT
jgi:hypothetical protein